MSPRLAFFCGQKAGGEQWQPAGGQGCGVTALRFPVDVRLCLSQDIELLKMAAASAAAFVCALLKLVKIVKGLGGVRGLRTQFSLPLPVTSGNWQCPPPAHSAPGAIVYECIAN